MSKLTREQRIGIYRKWKQGKSISQLSKRYGISRVKIQYLICLIDAHGIDILRKDKNNYYSKRFKQAVIDEVLIQRHSANGLVGAGTLSSRIKDYKANGYNVLERKRGRSAAMAKTKKKPKEMTAEEKLNTLEKKIYTLRRRMSILKNRRPWFKRGRSENRRKSGCRF